MFIRRHNKIIVSQPCIFLPNFTIPITNCHRGLIYKFCRFVNQWKGFISPVSMSSRVTFLGFCLIVFNLSYLGSLLFSGNKSCSFAKAIKLFLSQYEQKRILFSLSIIFNPLMFIIFYVGKKS